MQLYPKKRVDIVAETALQSRICRALEAAGAKGYTVSPASGNGARGMRQGDGVVEASGNVLITTVVNTAVLPAVLSAIQALLEDYAGALWVSDAFVVRDEHF
jgi:hypothetical protein